MAIYIFSPELLLHLSLLKRLFSLTVSQKINYIDHTPLKKLQNSYPTLQMKIH